MDIKKWYICYNSLYGLVPYALSELLYLNAMVPIVRKYVLPLEISVFVVLIDFYNYFRNLNI